LGQVFVSNVFASIRPMLDAGHWMLDIVGRATAWPGEAQAKTGARRPT